LDKNLGDTKNFMKRVAELIHTLHNAGDAETALVMMRLSSKKLVNTGFGSVDLIVYSCI